MRNNKSFNTIEFIIWLIVVILLLIILSFAFTLPFNDGSGIKDAGTFANYGTFIGGLFGTLFSLVGIIFLYRTLISQQAAIKSQDDAFIIQQFESTFFNLLKTQQDITEGIRAHVWYINDDFVPVYKTVSGREFFGYSKSEISNILNIFKKDNYPKYDSENVYYYPYEYERMNETALSISDSEYNFKKLKKKQKIEFSTQLYNINKELWEETKKISEIENVLKRTYDIFFEKYHYAIGHYFRHLYHIMLFVKNFKEFNPSVEIKKYFDFIQAQMSTWELMLLHYNAISFPKTLALIKEFNFLENLAEQDLIDTTHNCTGLNLKSRKSNV